MELLIDTTQADKVIFALRLEKKYIKKAFKLSHQDSYLMLGKLEEFLKINKVREPAAQINKIIASKGPGSFVGVRVGAAIVQALGFAWNVPIKFLDNKKFETY